MAIGLIKVSRLDDGLAVGEGVVIENRRIDGDTSAGGDGTLIVVDGIGSQGYIIARQYLTCTCVLSGDELAGCLGIGKTGFIVAGHGANGDRSDGLLGYIFGCHQAGDLVGDGMGGDCDVTPGLDGGR